MSGPMRLDQAVKEHWKLLIYGPPGVGKTRFGALSRQYRTFVIDVDDGINSATAGRIKAGLPLETVTFWNVKTTADFDLAIKWYLNNVRYFDLIVVDSFTELHQLILKETQDTTKRLTLDERGWGTVRTMSTNLTYWFKHLPSHVLFTAHEINKHDSTLGREVWRPAFDGRFAFEYAKHLDVIGRYQVMFAPGPAGPDGKPTQQLVRAINFGPTPFAHYKDRSDMLAEWEYPDIDTILGKCLMSTTPVEKGNVNG